MCKSLVGSLNWLSIATRPDIATITNILSAYLHKATPSHLAAVQRLIKYLKGSIDTGSSNFLWILLKQCLLLMFTGIHKTHLYPNHVHLKFYLNYSSQYHNQGSLYGLVDLCIDLQNDKQLQFTVPRKPKYAPLILSVFVFTNLISSVFCFN